MENTGIDKSLEKLTVKGRQELEWKLEGDVNGAKKGYF